MVDCSENNSEITYATIKNLYEMLDAYYRAALQRCGADAARNVASNRLIADIEELITNWEYKKS